MAKAPQPMVMYSMSFDAGVIAGFDEKAPSRL